MTKILMLLQSEFPPDIRLEKEIKSLSQNGFEVTLLCNQFVKNKLLEFPFCKIIHLRAFFNSVKLNKIINLPFFLNPRFVYYLFKAYSISKPDFVHAHDLPMMPLALILKRLYRIKVIFDMHENYPQALRAFEKKGLLNFLFKNPTLAEKLEQIAIRKADKIIVVVDENKNRLVKLGVASEKISVVSNTVDLETFKRNSKSITDFSEYKNKFIILYSGTVSPERGLKTAVLSMKYLKETFPSALLIILGDGKSVVELNNLRVENNLQNNVVLQSWCGHEKLPDYISRADLCIIPQPNNDFINTTIPHKLFEYMAIGKPVLVSDAEPFKRIIEETKAGLIFKSNNPEDFAQKVVELKQSKFNFGLNGRNAVEQKYNWGNDSKILLSLYYSFNEQK